MSDSARLIENLLYTYAERIDAGNLEGVADLFAHGRIVASPEAPMETVVAGRDEVLGMYQSSTRLYPCGTPRTKHVTTNAIIETDDDAGTAAGRTYYTVFQPARRLPAATHHHRPLPRHLPPHRRRVVVRPADHAGGPARRPQPPPAVRAEAVSGAVSDAAAEFKQ